MTANPFPSFHDGRLTSIAVAENSATLGLLRSDGTAFEMRLTGLEALRADQFLAGNIISHVEVVQGSPATRTNVLESLAALFPSPHAGAADPYNHAHSQRLRYAEDRIASGEAALVNLEPSYGCNLIALCAEVGLNAAA